MAPRHVRLLGLAAILGGLAGLAYWPFYSLAYHATPEGVESGAMPFVQAWAVPLRDAVEPLVTFSDPQTVYLTWGKALTFATLGWLAGLFALLGGIQSAGGKLARVAPAAAIGAATLLFLASIVLYWTPFIDIGFMVLAVPALLLSMVAFPLLGVAMLRSRVGPRAGAWLFIIGGPAIIPLAQPLGSLSGGLALLHAGWVVVGLEIRRRASAPAATEDAATT